MKEKIVCFWRREDRLPLPEDEDLRPDEGDRLLLEEGLSPPAEEDPLLEDEDTLLPEDARRRMLMNADSEGTSLDHAGEDTAAHDAHANAEASEYELEFDVKKTIWNKVMLLDFEENEEQGKIPQLEIPMKNIPVKEADDWWLMFFITIIEYTTLIIVIIFIFKRAPLVWHVIDYLVTFCFMIYLNF